MKFLIDVNEYGLAVVKKDESVRISSRTVAELFGKLHKHVLRDIDKLTSEDSGLSAEFVETNFGPNKYKDRFNRSHPEYLLTFDGFMMLTEEQLNKIKFLQRNDSVLLDVVSDIQVRKSLLASQLEDMYHDRKRN